MLWLMAHQILAFKLCKIKFKNINSSLQKGMYLWYTASEKEWLMWKFVDWIFLIRKLEDVLNYYSSCWILAKKCYSQKISVCKSRCLPFIHFNSTNSSTFKIIHKHIYFKNNLNERQKPGIIISKLFIV